MKKITFFVLLTALSQSVFAINKGIEDTSNVLISTPEVRAAFLTNEMAKKLGLDEATEQKIQEVNIRYEEELQKLVIDNPPPKFKPSGGKKKTNDLFDFLTESREKDYKKVMSSKQYKQYQKLRWAMRNALTSKVREDVAEAERLAAEQKAREEEEARIKQAEEERLAAEAAAAAKAKKNKKGAKGKKNDKKKSDKKGGGKKKKH